MTVPGRRRRCTSRVSPALLTTLLAVTACSGGDDPSDQVNRPGARSASTSGAADLTPPPELRRGRHPLPEGKALTNDPELYDDVALTGCRRTPQGWRAGGTVENTGAEPREYSIVVFFTDAQARAVDSATATVAVRPGDDRRWTAQRRFDGPDDVRCLVRAVHPAA